MQELLSSLTFIFSAFFTDAPEFKPALFHIPFVPQPVDLCHRILNGDHHIQNAPAALTDKMAVGRQRGIEAVRSVRGDLPDLSCLYQ